MAAFLRLDSADELPENMAVAHLPQAVSLMEQLFGPDWYTQDVRSPEVLARIEERFPRTAITSADSPTEYHVRALAAYVCRSAIGRGAQFDQLGGWMARLAITDAMRLPSQEFVERKPTPETFMWFVLSVASRLREERSSYASAAGSALVHVVEASGIENLRPSMPFSSDVVEAAIDSVRQTGGSTRENLTAATGALSAYDRMHAIVRSQQPNDAERDRKRFPQIQKEWQAGKRQFTGADFLSFTRAHADARLEHPYLTVQEHSTDGYYLSVRKTLAAILPETEDPSPVTGRDLLERAANTPGLSRGSGFHFQRACREWDAFLESGEIAFVTDRNLFDRHLSLSPSTGTWPTDWD